MVSSTECWQLAKGWLDLGLRYCRGQCTPEEEMSVSILLFILALAFVVVPIEAARVLREKAQEGVRRLTKVLR